MSKIAKAEFAALEKVFAAEIENRLPFQSKAKVYTTMEGYGWVQRMARKFGKPPFLATVVGWALTDEGRYLYCSCCPEPTEQKS